MKRWLILSVILLAPIGALIGWATHLEDRLPDDTRVDLLVVDKAKRELTVYSQGKPLKTYKVALGRVPIGPKRAEGDKKTPEGKYRIDSRKADSSYFRALHISYPSQADVEAARKRNESPGGDIMIHGLRNGLGWLGKLHRLADWTLGCIAVTNKEVEELWRVVPDGTPVEVRP